MSALGQKRAFCDAGAMSVSDILCAQRYVCSSHVTLARRSGAQALHRGYQGFKPQLEKVGKRVAHQAATLIVPSRLSTITGE